MAAEPVELTEVPPGYLASRKVLRYVFVHGESGKRAKIDLWHSASDPTAVELGFHCFKDVFAGAAPQAFRFAEADVKRRGFARIVAKRRQSDCLSFLMHMGYWFASEAKFVAFTKRLRSRLPGAPKLEFSARRAVASAVFKASRSLHKLPQTTLVKRLQ